MQAADCIVSAIYLYLVIVFQCNWTYSVYLSHSNSVIFAFYLRETSLFNEFLIEMCMRFFLSYVKTKHSESELNLLLSRKYFCSFSFVLGFLKNFVDV